METKEYLKRYAWVYLYVAAFFLGTAGLLRHTVETVGSMEPFSGRPVIVIDAGHGAPDGGSTGISGTREEAVNLEISERLELLLALMGYEIGLFVVGLFNELTRFARISSFAFTGLYTSLLLIPLYPLIYKIGLIGGNTWKE